MEKYEEKSCLIQIINERLEDCDPHTLRVILAAIRGICSNN